MQNVTAIEKTLDYQKKLRFLSQVFFNEADQDLLDRLKSVESLFDTDDPSIKEGLNTIKKFAEFPIDNAMLELAVDYTGLFAGTKIGCPLPYESVYTSEDGLLMQEANDQVLRIYRNEEFKDYLENNEPQDHISNELDFMAFLSQKLVDALKNDEEESAKSYLDKQKIFLEQHLLNWVPSFCRDVEKKA